MTDAERRLWKFLRGRGLQGLKFRRQVPFGPYILDFYSVESRVAVELDGGHHYHPAKKREDDIRAGRLASFGIKTLRYSDWDALSKTQLVLEDILRIAAESSPEPSPFQGEGRN